MSQKFALWEENIVRLPLTENVKAGILQKIESVEERKNIIARITNPKSVKDLQIYANLAGYKPGWVYFKAKDLGLI